MKIKKFNESIRDEMKPKDREDVVAAFAKQGISEQDILGGLTQDEYGEIIDFVKDLQTKADNEENPFKKEDISDEERTLSEVLLNIAQHPFDRNLDYDMFYNRRLGFIKSNKNKLD